MHAPIRVITRSKIFPLARRYFSDKRGDGLRILFCGADYFSIASLKALHEESKQATSNILSLDVVTKNDKPSGRGLKTLKSPPIKPVALGLGLPLHQIDTFTGWSPPKNDLESINLVIAVSFGLLIPPRILNGSRYGGLNVHPSLLPDLRGAAPIQWSIIHGRKETGISIQTLHPTKFDEGLILDQTEPIPMPEGDSRSVTKQLSKIGADLLVKAIRNRLYLPPYQAIASKTTPSLAPRIKSADKHVSFQDMSLQEILNRNRAIPKLFVMARREDGSEVRILFGTDIREVTNEIPANRLAECKQVPVGHPYSVWKSEALYINTKCGHVLVAPDIIVAGDKQKPAVAAALRAHLLTEMQPGSYVRPFHEPLMADLTL